MRIYVKSCNKYYWTVIDNYTDSKSQVMATLKIKKSDVENCKCTRLFHGSAFVSRENNEIRYWYCSKSVSPCSHLEYHFNGPSAFDRWSFCASQNCWQCRVSWLIKRPRAKGVIACVPNKRGNNIFSNDSKTIYFKKKKT